MSSTNRGGERRKNDSYYTNPDLADFLVRLLVEDEWLDPDAPCRVLEPHAGKGAWIRAIRRHVPRAIITANDLVGDVSRWFECGADHASVGDFLELDDESFDAIIGNPPYSGAEEHVRHALTLSERPSFTGGGTDSTPYGLFVWSRGWQAATRLRVVSWRVHEGKKRSGEQAGRR